MTLPTTYLKNNNIRPKVDKALQLGLETAGTFDERKVDNFVGIVEGVEPNGGEDGARDAHDQ